MLSLFPSLLHIFVTLLPSQASCSLYPVILLAECKGGGEKNKDKKMAGLARIFSPYHPVLKKKTPHHFSGDHFPCAVR
jgi:hypothetical protein